ncbi:MAG: exodeoxyribonuclease VII small subunit [Nitrospirota bacterium]
MSELKFEDALKSLETIVSQLEKGDISLEDSLKFFEDGIKLSRDCLKMLDEAEKKVEILLKDKTGKKMTKPFQLEFEGTEDLEQE